MGDSLPLRYGRVRLATAALVVAAGNLAGVALAHGESFVGGGGAVAASLLIAALVLWPLRGGAGLLQALALATGVLGLAFLLAEEGEVLRRLLPVIGILAGGLLIVRGAPEEISRR